METYVKAHYRSDKDNNPITIGLLWEILTHIQVSEVLREQMIRFIMIRMNQVL